MRLNKTNSASTIDTLEVPTVSKNEICQIIQEAKTHDDFQSMQSKFVPGQELVYKEYEYSNGAIYKG